jgi:hypothetical protein
MLLYQARTAAVTGDRKPSALERSGGSPSHRWDGREHGPALPLRASPRYSAVVAGYHEMPREQQEAA